MAPPPPTEYSGRSLRVLYLDQCAEPAGGELALLDWLPHLPANGVEPYVVVGEDGPLVPRFSAVARTRVVPLPAAVASVGRAGAAGPVAKAFAGAQTLTYAARIARLARTVRADVIHCNSLKAGVYGTLAGRLARVPVVWHVHDRLSDEYLAPAMLTVVRPLLRRLPAVAIAVSHAAAATIPAGPRVEVVHGPISLRPTERSAAPRPTTFATISRLSPWKGQDLFLEAFAEAFPDGPQVAVVAGAALFGEEEYAERLRDLAHRLGVAGRVRFSGHVDDVAGLLAEVDVVVHTPTIPEPFGRVVGEAMAAGLPVVAPAAGGPLEIIDSGRDGILFPPGDRSALVATLRNLASDPELRARLGREAPAAVARMAPAAVATRLRGIYDGILTAPPGAAAAPPAATA